MISPSVTTGNPPNGSASATDTVLRSALSIALQTAAKEAIIHNFEGPPYDGYQPESTLLNVNGTLYGTTDYGGSAPYGGRGTVFSVTPSGAYSLYGTSYSGGAVGGANGTIFTVSLP